MLSLLFSPHQVVYEGKLSSLRRVKDSVEEVAADLECGLGCDGWTGVGGGRCAAAAREAATVDRRLGCARIHAAVRAGRLGDEVLGVTVCGWRVRRAGGPCPMWARGAEGLWWSFCLGWSFPCDVP